MKPYYTDERTGILYKLIGDYYFPVGNRFGIADDGDEDVLEMLRSAADGQPTPHAGVFLGRFAEAHRQYLKEHKRSLYSALQSSGKLGQYQYDGYVFVDELGERYHPNWLTAAFPKFVENHGLPRMRFHDLRHSCASLLLANGVPLKQIQEWLGHSDFSTTANIYAHLDYRSKLSSAQAMVDGITLPEADHFGSRWETVPEEDEDLVEVEIAG